MTIGSARGISANRYKKEVLQIHEPQCELDKQTASRHVSSRKRMEEFVRQRSATAQPSKSPRNGDVVHRNVSLSYTARK